MPPQPDAPGRLPRPGVVHRISAYLRSHAAALALLLVAATIGGWGLRSSLALGSWTIDETFAGATASGWSLGGSAALSANGGGDAVGSGWLRLTPRNVANSSGYAFHTAQFAPSQGMQVEFDWADWGGSGASGLGLVLIDAATGANTYLGIGIDRSGGYFNSGYTDTISINQGGSPGSWTPLAGKPLGLSVGTTGRSSTAGDADYRRIRFTLLPGSPNYRVTVTVLAGASSLTLFDNVEVPAPTYTNLQLMVGGSNGSGGDALEIRNFKAGPAPRITGTVFEDVNYGGGPGRDRATALAAGGSGRSNARIELFDGAGNLIGTATSGTGGGYSIPAAAHVSQTVRVVGASVGSGRTGTTGSLLPVQTFRTADAGTAAVSAVADRVGGETPALADAGNASTTLAALTTASTTAQSIAPVTPGAQGIDGVDFGFNFSTVVNASDSGQGSLRQAITNANTLGGDTSLAQAGRTAGIENLVFMIPNGTTGAGGSLNLAAGGLRTAQNLFSGGAATITPATSLPLVTATLAIDASTQPGWTGNPIVALNGSAACAVEVCQGLQLSTANGGTVRGLQFAGWTGTGARALHLLSGNHRIAGNWFGLQPDGTATNGSRNYQSIALRGAAATGITVGGTTAADRNIVANAYSTAVYLYAASNNTFIGNWFGMAADGQTRALNMVGIANYASGTVIGGTSAGQGNVFGASTNTHVSVDSNGGAVANASASILGNRFGFTATGTPLSASASEAVQFIGVASGTLGGTAAGAGNVITGTIARAVSIFTAAQKVSVRGNAMYGNGGIGIDLNRDGITANDGATNATQANNGIDSPVFTSASLSGSTLSVAGYVGTAAGQTAFAGVAVDVYLSDVSSANGSGQAYLGSLTADASGNFSGTLTNVSGLTAGTSRITGVATDGSGNSSEFGANALVAATITGTVFEDINYGGGAGRSLASSSGLPRSGARVELFDSTGAYVSATTTAADGSYSFSGLVTSTTYHVRVVASSVLSGRTGSIASLLPVLTWRTSTSAGTVTGVADKVGGRTRRWPMRATRARARPSTPRPMCSVPGCRGRRTRWHR